MSRITSHIVNATKRHSSNRVVVKNDVLHQSALSRSLTSARPPTDIHRPRRRYFGDASKCCSSQCASVSSPSTSSSEENIGRRVENLHGSSVVRPRLSGENLILPNEIITTFSPLRPSTFAATMEQQQQQQRQSCSQPQSGYHQLAPLRASTPGETREDAMEVALGAIDAVTPNEMIVKAITVEDGKLLVRGWSTVSGRVILARFLPDVYHRLSIFLTLPREFVYSAPERVRCSVRQSRSRNDPRRRRYCRRSHRPWGRQRPFWHSRNVT